MVKVDLSSKEKIQKFFGTETSVMVHEMHKLEVNNDIGGKTIINAFEGETIVIDKEKITIKPAAENYKNLKQEKIQEQEKENYIKGCGDMNFESKTEVYEKKDKGDDQNSELKDEKKK